ncbi:1-acyl-sn-glycerol-3-phosphate acyltransferase [Urechidicola vernalis]|uniref:1-acyl-sn-glycerol-3-phosphate acyltransferase n=1 Tax=Urechidicola vernalis TaxID=3075600 RepID=A0ABU2Y1X5_9FLAO|nr:1-acyl-sn-glycerol-3-phosphate acyltransferase [Urechidicola sp. P050]MDT0552203.1 1-acyl-sn-glycerol-3-phosphate acyltransferase [Urechidicola sp. P050]
MKGISRFILHALMGWKIEGGFPSDIKKYIIIVAPHTHWIDFIMGLLIRSSTGLKANYIGKASLFKGPFGFVFRMTGGVPVNRSQSTNKVDAIVELYNSREKFVLSLSPEGTRKKVEVWKSGFYHIAKGANVPIVRTVLDFEHKLIIIAEPFYTTSNKETDIKEIRSLYNGVKGKIPEYS